MSNVDPQDFAALFPSGLLWRPSLSVYSAFSRHKVIVELYCLASLERTCEGT